MYSAFGVDHGAEVSKAFRVPFRKPKIGAQQQGTQSTSGPTTPKPPGPSFGQRMRSMNPIPKIKSRFSKPPQANSQQQPENPGTVPNNNPPAENRPPDVSKPVTNESTPWERMNDSMKKNPGAWVAGGTAGGTAGGAGVTYLSTRRR